MKTKKRTTGFTLMEILLVMVIMTSILLMMLGYVTTKIDESRRDKTILQMEQLLNAGLSYYVSKAMWPTMDDLQQEGYIPKTTPKTPWGTEYFVSNDLEKGLFSLCTTLTDVGTVKASLEASIIAGRLPMAFTTEETISEDACPTSDQASECTGTSCTVVTTVNIPGQNLNNARSVNFAGIYHNGACVPQPKCPKNLTPSIIVSPTAVSGNYEGDSSVYPISSFTARARAPIGTDFPAKCTEADPNSTTPGTCESTEGVQMTSDPNNLYWRVCLDVITERGTISKEDYGNWNADSGTVMAITRCVPDNEPAGSAFDVFQNR